MQRNWIGRSEGARLRFTLETGDALEVFTTRPDTVWGATFMVLAPEHPLVAKITTAERRAEVEAYIEQARRADRDRAACRPTRPGPKTGVFTGGYAINPVTDERIPIWIADYVLMGYGTGAIMAVPATTSATSSSPARSTCRSASSSSPRMRRTLDPATMTEAYAGPACWSTPGRFDRQARAGGAAGDHRLAGRDTAAARRRSPTGCATG